MMRFKDDFNINKIMMHEVKKALCENDVCPRILLNQPEGFEGEIFFENTDFEKSDSIKILH